MTITGWRPNRRAVLLGSTALALSTTGAWKSPAFAQSVPRKDTLILDSSLQRIDTPQNYNPFLPSTTLPGGLHQVGYESLFYLNLETGELIPWQAESYQFNATFDEVTIKIRNGVMWSDGQPFTADDIVFTMTTLKNNAAA